MYPFKEGSFAPRNGWYVVAFPHEITRTLLTRWVLGEPVVLYRKQDGTAIAVNGRCPHRHFPLGESRLIGDEIQCGYHGITFGADGRCTRVPSQDAIPGVYRIRTYPLVERGLWAWLWAGDPDLADEGLIPTPEEIGLTAPGYVSRPFYSMLIKGRYQLMNDNLLDLTHLGYLHGSSIGTEENASTPEVRDDNDRRISSRRHMMGAACPDVLTRLHDYRGPIDRVAGMDFYFPGFHAGLDETRIPEGHATRPGEVLRMSKVWHAVTPSTHDETLYFFAMGMTDPDGLDFMHDYLKPVVEEDAFATEQIERMIRRIGRMPPELMLKSDATAMRGRRILQAMMDAEREDPRSRDWQAKLAGRG